MNKYYLIVPGALLLVFLGFERNFQKTRRAEEFVRAEVEAMVKTIEDEERANQQLAAHRDAEKRAADRERQEQERAAKKRRDSENIIATLQTQAEDQEADLARLASETEALKTQLTRARTRRDMLERETFDLARAVELQRIDRRSADMEIQRTTAMVTARLNDSPWANAPR